jgi:5-methylcytosine-specific restriction protein B
MDGASPAPKRIRGAHARPLSSFVYDGASSGGGDMAVASQTFAEAVAAWDRDAIRPRLEAWEAERAEAVRQFPLDAWPTMALERYAVGTEQSRDSFGYWMEFHAPQFVSIAGGSARKHLIYKRSTGGWFFYPPYKDEHDAWEAVRAGFVKAFELAQADDILSIGDIQAIAFGPALVTKAVFTYFPDKIMPVCSHAHQQHFWEILGGQGNVPYSAPGAHRLLGLARERPEFAGWSPMEIERFLYAWADPRQVNRIVKIAPGPDAELWPDCRTRGYIRVGWDDVGDLRDFASKEEFRARFGEVYSDTYSGNQAKISEKANEVWTLVELEPGDLVVANKGTSRVLAVGTVVEPGYERNLVLADYAHTVHVAWDESQARDIDPIKRWAFKTVAPVGQAEYQRILAGHTPEGEPPEPPEAPPDPIFAQIDGALRRKGQAILYGPPGTGKTYSARRFSVWWLARRAGLDAGRLLGDRDAFLQAERTLSTAQAEGRVWWVVANPKEWSWDQIFQDGWVDYRYGRLQRNYPLVQPGDLVIGYQANPDKRVLALARIREGLHTSGTGPVITLEPVARVANGPTYEELVKSPELRTSEPLRFRNQGTLFALTSEEATYLLAWLTERDGSLTALQSTPTESIGPLTRITFHPSYTYEDFVEGFKPVPSGSGQLELQLVDGVFKRVCRAAQANQDQPFLLLIDEINRGNIPKIFGELITLLELDKRNLSVVLPQSRETFAVPPNVYLLGTMNTADRSIKLLDAALRRRFAFIELMPDTRLLEGTRIAGLDIAQFLSELNRRVARVEGREKQVGHSFLMDGDQPIADAEAFAAAFRHDILPLLQEYAYEDYRELVTYLGPALIDADEQRVVRDKLDDPQELIAALIDEFQPVSPGADASEPS